MSDYFNQTGILMSYKILRKTTYEAPSNGLIFYSIIILALLVRPSLSVKV